MLTYKEKAEKVKAKRFVIHFKTRYIRHWGIAQWIEYIDQYGEWL